MQGKSVYTYFSLSASKDTHLMSTSPKLPVNCPSMYSSVLANYTYNKAIFRDQVLEGEHFIIIDAKTVAHLEVHVRVH